MNRLRFLSILAVVFVTAYCGGPASGAPSAQQSSALKQAIQNGALIVDVRTPAEFAGGHYEKAINIPVDQLDQRLAEFGADKNRPIVLYCRSGHRAGIALQILQKNGYAHVLNGINQANMP